MSESDFCGTGLGNTTAPPAGTPDWSNLVVYAATTNTGIKVQWNNVATLPNAVAYFTLYRNSSNSESGATAIWSGNSTSYHDPSGSLAVGVTYYYWLQCTALNGFSSPWFGPASAAMRTEQDNLVEVMQNQVLSSSFFPELVSGLDRITGLEISLIANRNDLDINDALITAALEAVRADLLADGVVNANGFLNLSTDIANVAYRFDVFGAQLGPAIALIQSEQIAYAAADIVFAQDINTVQAQLSNPGANPSTLWSGVTENKEALVTIDGTARAKYSLKVEADSNGNQAIGGIVLGAESDGTPEGTSSTVLILADTFGITSPNPTDAGNYIIPFVVGTDDVTGASGVFIDSAYVNNLDVQTFQIAGNAVTVPTYIAFTFPAYNVTGSYSAPTGSNGAKTCRSYVRTSGGRLLVTCTFVVNTTTNDDNSPPSLYAKLKVGTNLTSFTGNLGSSEIDVGVPQNGSSTINIKMTSTVSVATSANHGTPGVNGKYLDNYYRTLSQTFPAVQTEEVFSTSGGDSLTLFGDPAFNPNDYYSAVLIHASNPSITENVTVTDRNNGTFRVTRSVYPRSFPAGSKLKLLTGFPTDYVTIELQVKGSLAQIVSCDFTVISCKR